MNRFLDKGNKDGFTIIEVVLGIAILIIIALIAIPRFPDSSEKTRITVDQANLKSLNTATFLYANAKNITSEDIFAGVSTDNDRMQLLVDNGVLNKVLQPQQKKVKFKWGITNQTWDIGRSSISYNAIGDGGSMKITDLLDPKKFPLKNGTWNSDGENGIKCSYGRLFVENSNEEYLVTTKAKLSAGNDGGYGIFFETSVTEDEGETGYILQFDRGRGQLIIKERNNGGEILGDVLRVSKLSNEQYIPHKENAWWTDEHEIKLEVTKIPVTIDGRNKQLTVSIDGDEIISSFKFQGNSAPENNYTGFRSWGKTTNYKGIEIEGL